MCPQSHPWPLFTCWPLFACVFACWPLYTCWPLFASLAPSSHHWPLFTCSHPWPPLHLLALHWWDALDSECSIFVQKILFIQMLCCTLIWGFYPDSALLLGLVCCNQLRAGTRGQREEGAQHEHGGHLSGYITLHHAARFLLISRASTGSLTTQ